MGVSIAACLSRGKDDWRTPPALFAQLDSEFHFTVDRAATAESNLCAEYYGPGSDTPDALTVPWQGIGWLNPPYSQIAAFIAKAAAEAWNGATTVMLIPSRTDTKWWHRYIWNAAKHSWQTGVEGRFIKGRLKFINPDGPLLRGSKMNGSNNAAPFPSVLIVFNVPSNGGRVR